MQCQRGVTTLRCQRGVITLQCQRGVVPCSVTEVTAVPCPQRDNNFTVLEKGKNFTVSERGSTFALSEVTALPCRRGVITLHC